MKIGERIVQFSITRPKLVTLLAVLISILIGLAIPFMKVDTDPENMLSKDEFVRIFHNKMKKKFSLYDMIVVGVANEKDPDGVFNPSTLHNIYELTKYIQSLRWEKDGKKHGVISYDVIAPSNVDNVTQGGPGEVKFEWLMSSPPKTREEALKIREAALSNPIFKDTLVSEDGRAICLYIPITEKKVSYKVVSKIKEKIATFKGDEKYYITGLPVAEDTFGVEMFKQMAISAPTAMFIIFVLMYLFFRKLILIISPMIVAMLSVLFTMGLLVATGNTVHIMSSMIPIFIMPIAVLDSIHILSEFFDRYPQYKDRKKTITHVMQELFMPMLYTSLTSSAGFASLALTPIPPVQVFGIFVGIGIMFAWILTVTFIPAYTTFIKEESLENFGRKSERHQISIIDRFITGIGKFTVKSKWIVIFITFIIALISIYGITLIQVNDNPVKWFTKTHPIRVADRVLNKHFAGTYMAYLNIQSKNNYSDIEKLKNALNENVVEKIKDSQIKQVIKNYIYNYKGRDADKFLKDISNFIEEKYDNAPDDKLDIWDNVLSKVDFFIASQKYPFKRPDFLRFLDKLQQYIESSKVVGKVSSVVTLVKKINQEMTSGTLKDFRIPDTIGQVAEDYITFQNSHKPNDLWHFITPQYDSGIMWVQLKTGDNKDMEKVLKRTKKFLNNNKAPIPIHTEWFGLTYINVIWQNKMVKGMLQSFLGSFLVVLLLMILLFKSFIWGLLSMIPLTITIGSIYGAIGIIGKDYDMPVAVLSSLTLGLAVDFAIHFLARSRVLVEKYGSWEKAAPYVFGEPARAITRNIIVIATGFLPLLAAPLVPYKTVGTFLATILAVSGIGTLIILPAMVSIIGDKLFKLKADSLICSRGTCVSAIVITLLVVDVNIHQYVGITWDKLIVGTIVGLMILGILCVVISGLKCKMKKVISIK